MNKIVVEDYNFKWESTFKELKEVYYKQLSEIDVQIEHVGSTSVKGLSAKPIIDIDIIVKNESDKCRVINELAQLGYKHLGDLGIKGREAFSRESEEVPYNQRKIWIDHHLYLLTAGCDALLNHIKLRDFLMHSPQAIKEYSQLKVELSKKYPYDIDLYIEGKTQFIINALKAWMMDDLALKKIIAENKKSVD